MAERDSAGWGEVIAGLESDKAGLETELAGIDAEARPLALPASIGDKAAAAELDRLESRRAGLVRRVAILAAAIDDASGQLAAALAREAEAAAAEQRAALCVEAVVQMRLAARFDEAAKQMAAAMNDYNAHIPIMTRAGLEPHLAGKLRNRTMMAGALHTAGVSAAGVSLPPVGPSFRETLAGWNGRMLRDLLPDPAEQEAA